MPVRLRLGWDLSRPKPKQPTLEPGLQEAAEELMGKIAVPFGGWYEFVRVQCGMCNTVYIVQEHLQETSNSAYRVQIADIARMVVTSAA
jgi:hypothetical protein